MAINLKKTGAVIAGLCLLCCAAPFAALFLGGAGLAGLATLLNGLGRELQYAVAAIAVAAMALGAFRIWRRSRTSSACDLPE